MTHPLTNSYMTHRERERDYHDYLSFNNEGTLCDSSINAALMNCYMEGKRWRSYSENIRNF